MAERALAAGDFADWLAGFRAALATGSSVDVPCDGCTACCTSGQFVHIGPDESDTLAHIPGELLAPAPGLPAGHVVLGYDSAGQCPMLVDGACSIYSHRPRACRIYDCRAFVAAGVEVDAEKPALARRVARWRFSHPAQVDRRLHDAVEAAASFIRDDAELAADGMRPRAPADLAVLAIAVHDVSDVESDPIGVRVAVRRALSTD
jgi:Fe-S-cluster containining protein